MKIVLPVVVLVMLCLSRVDTGAAQETLTLQYARGFKVESLGGCKLVTIKPAWHKGEGGFHYLLVPMGQGVPAQHPSAQIIRVPVKRIVTLSTTQLAYIDAAGLTDRLVGLAGFDYVNTASVRRRIEAGELKSVGQFTRLNMETLIDLAPDLILASASGSAYDVNPKLIEAGLPTILITDHLEHHPLGRLEWIKLMAMLFGTQDHADPLFDTIAARYQALAEKARTVRQRPKVIINTPFQGQWWIAKGESFVARYIADAGGDYLWRHVPGSGSTPMDVEAVYEQALAADIWLNTGTWKNRADAETADPRLALVPALKQSRVYNNNKRLNPHGGNDFWESGTLRPDMVLA
ncbi:MAG: ABC transporter substrate-binding protein, partial [Desulfatitalea sp.]|nr:ABC transporter substrate-binding protein [Desulfatitalea sp.]NNK01413.1 ABC transporter substrate-binding protein [Desulfatitalea sp.]